MIFIVVFFCLFVLCCYSTFVVGKMVLRDPMKLFSRVPHFVSFPYFSVYVRLVHFGTWNCQPRYDVAQGTVSKKKKTIRGKVAWLMFLLKRYARGVLVFRCFPHAFVVRVTGALATVSCNCTWITRAMEPTFSSKAKIKKETMKAFTVLALAGSAAAFAPVAQHVRWTNDMIEMSILW